MRSWDCCSGLLLEGRDTWVSDAFFGVAFAGFVLMPVAVAIAILRYRLYEIDRIVSRTLVYAALTVVLGAAYVGLVLAGQALFSSFAGGSNLAIAASTLVVAALFLPVRSRVQQLRRPALLPAPLRRAAHARGVRRAAARAGRARGADERASRIVVERDDAARARLGVAARSARHEPTPGTGSPAALAS